MPRYADIYVLSPSRTKAAIRAFLEKFVPDRAETSKEYWIPEHVDTPHTVLRSSAEAISYCCGHQSETQSLCWRRVGEDGPKYAMVIFTKDAQVILGLSAEEYAAQALLAVLKSHAGSDVGYITVEGPPPQTAAEFRRIARESSG